MTWSCEQNKKSKNWLNEAFRPIEKALNSVPDVKAVRQKRYRVRKVKRQLRSNIDFVYPCWK